LFDTLSGTSGASRASYADYDSRVSASAGTFIYAVRRVPYAFPSGSDPEASVGKETRLEPRAESPALRLGASPGHWPIWPGHGSSLCDYARRREIARKLPGAAANALDERTLATDPRGKLEHTSNWKFV
jgi:hypothetical protein